MLAGYVATGGDTTGEGFALGNDVSTVPPVEYHLYAVRPPTTKEIKSTLMTRAVRRGLCLIPPRLLISCSLSIRIRCLRVPSA